MRFSILYEELKFSDVFSAASPEEVAVRKKKHLEVEIADLKKTKLQDGTWQIHADLIISSSQVNSLDGLNVSIVDEDFYCSYNYLTSLVGCPKKIGKDFNCTLNQLTSLKGCPSEIGHSFDCSWNKPLTSLVGCPNVIEGDFSCGENGLYDLVGAPERVGRDFICSNNKGLTSLEGCPKFVGRHFYCKNLKEGVFTEEDVRAICHVEGSVRFKE